MCLCVCFFLFKLQFSIDSKRRSFHITLFLLHIFALSFLDMKKNTQIHVYRHIYHFRKVPFKIGLIAMFAILKFSPLLIFALFFNIQFVFLYFMNLNPKQYRNFLLCTQEHIQSHTWYIVHFDAIPEIRINSCEIIVPFIFNFLYEWYIFAAIDAYIRFMWRKR